jgi:Na+/proline symporter
MRYRSRPIGRLATVLLVLLGTFQIAEYAICVTGHALVWMRIAFAAITFLPVIGIHLIAMLTERIRWLGALYALAAGFVVVILPWNTMFSGATCPGTFVLFTNHPVFDAMYGTY